MMRMPQLLSALLLLYSLVLAGQSNPPPQDATAGVSRLTLQQAEQIAMRNNPSVSIAKLAALAQAQVTREVRAGELPLVNGDLTAVTSHTGSRIAAGGLNNPLILERAAGGVSVSQLITDFGRTRNLVASAKLQQDSAQASQQATAADIRLAVDDAFYRALGSQALVAVAEQTVNARQTTVDQVSALANARLKSDLDLTFANVNLAQAKLLLLDAQNGEAGAMAALNTLLGNEGGPGYVLAGGDEQCVAGATGVGGGTGAAGIRRAARPAGGERALPVGAEVCGGGA